METPFEFGSYKTVGGYDAIVYERIKYDDKLFLYGSVKLRNDTYSHAPMFWSENGGVYVPDGKWTLDDKVCIFHPRCKGPGLALLYSFKTYDSIFQSHCFNLTSPKLEPMNESTLTTPIKPGKYKMRNGFKAIIAAIAPDEIKQAQPLTGWLQYADNKWCGGSWAANGAFHLAFSNPSEFDLISPWIDAPIFSHWDKVPWAKAVFRSNDMWYASSEIISSPSAWVIDRTKYPYAIWTPLREEHYPAFTGLNKDSLILRPEGV